jgi:peptide/nickel transport system permease protein
VLKTIITRLVSLIPLLLGVSLITFSLLQLAPGDPAEILLKGYEEAPTREAVEALRAGIGLNDPPYRQYWKWLCRVIRGDLGVSFRTGEPVASRIFQRLPATLELAASAFIFMMLLAIGYGLAGALCRDSLFDHLLRAWTILTVSVPGFWLGLLLMLFFSINLDLFPLSGRGGPSHLFLPVITLSLGTSASYGRIFRAALIEVLHQDYIKLAYAKGLGRYELVTRHVMKNALLPLVTLFGISLGNLLGGSVIVETIFSWPGVGKMAVEAILNRDYPVILGYVLMMAMAFMLSNLLVDVLYYFLDPKIRANSSNHEREDSV